MPTIHSERETPNTYFTADDNKKKRQYVQPTFDGSDGGK
jgi:hypothetical protein